MEAHIIIYYLEHIFLVSLIMLIWLKTEAFHEYCKLFRFKKIFYTEEYSMFAEATPEMGYIEYLQVQYDCFFIRLVSCPICLGLWLNIILSLLLWNFDLFFVKVGLSFLLYFTTVFFIKKSV